VATVDGEALVVVAATVGDARLIDNATVRRPARLGGAEIEYAAEPEAPCNA
jgi:hypothetical protein